MVAAFLHAGCAFGSLARCCLELLFHLLKVPLLLAPAAGLLLSSLTLQALTQGPSAAPPRRATPKGCPCGPQPRPGRCAQDEGKPRAHLGQHAQRHVHQLRLVHAVHGRRPGHRNGTVYSGKRSGPTHPLPTRQHYLGSAAAFCRRRRPTRPGPPARRSPSPAAPIQAGSSRRRRAAAILCAAAILRAAARLEAVPFRPASRYAPPTCCRLFFFLDTAAVR